MITANGTITLTARPAFPWGTAHTDSKNNRKLWKTGRPVPLNYEIPMAWHHIIAWRYLRDGWSALATSQQWDAIFAWADCWKLDYDTGGLVDLMQAGALGAPHNSDMFDMLCWAEFNLVEGPSETNRTDDPGSEALDPFEGLKAPSNVRNRTQTLKSIFTIIKPWAANKDDVSDKDAKNLIQDFKKLRTSSRSPISMFDPKLWELVAEGRHDKYGNASRHPTWKKA